MNSRIPIKRNSIVSVFPILLWGAGLFLLNAFPYHPVWTRPVRFLFLPLAAGVFCLLVFRAFPSMRSHWLTWAVGVQLLLSLHRVGYFTLFLYGFEPSWAYFREPIVRAELRVEMMQLACGLLLSVGLLVLWRRLPSRFEPSRLWNSPARLQGRRAAILWGERGFRLLGRSLSFWILPLWGAGLFLLNAFPYHPVWTRPVRFLFLPLAAGAFCLLVFRAFPSMRSHWLAWAVGVQLLLSLHRVGYFTLFLYGFEPSWAYFREPIVRAELRMEIGEIITGLLFSIGEITYFLRRIPPSK